jgi:uncharacterized protein YecT (DUF1311 family)
MRSTIRIGTALLLIVLSSPAARAASEPDVDCRKAASTPEIALCAQRDYEAADAKLNTAYRAALASIDKADVPADVRADWRKALVEAQRRWIAFRDAECTVTGFEWYGGTGRSTAEFGCQRELTVTRTKQLRAHADPQ